MTGAPMPAGADTVVRQEDTSRDGATVLIEVATPLATSVRPRGADMRAGATVLEPGTAAHEHRYRRRGGARQRTPRGGNASARGPARDRGRAGGGRHASRSRAARGLRTPRCSPPPCARPAVLPGLPGHRTRFERGSVRALLETPRPLGPRGEPAGVSVGDHDWVREVASEMGTISTWRVAMRPGKPVLTGTIGDAVFIGLPGNPVSSSVTFELFARPVIQQDAGRARAAPTARCRFASARR